MKILSRLLNAFAWFVFMGVSLGGMYLFWEDHQDVMKYIDIKPNTRAVLSDGSVRMALVGEKGLSCDRVPWSENGYAIIDGYNKEASFRWVDDLSPTSSFPKGKLDIGIAEFSAEGIEEADFIGFNIKHICHGVTKTSPEYWMQVEHD